MDEAEDEYEDARQDQFRHRDRTQHGTVKMFWLSLLTANIY